MREKATTALAGLIRREVEEAMELKAQATRQQPMVGACPIIWTPT
jgi:hypothetical protein